MKTTTALPAALIAIALSLAVVSQVDADTGGATSTIDRAVTTTARSIVGELQSQLGQKLKGALAEAGPIAAVSVCKDSAPAIAKTLSSQHGVQVTRVGTRVRNTQMGTPNTWQQAALAEFEERLAKGEDAATMEYWQTVDTGHGQRELHYAKAITVQPMCLTCHGQAQDIAAPLAEKIRQAYPDDQATGYSVGKLRGAIVLTKPL